MLKIVYMGVYPEAVCCGSEKNKNIIIVKIVI